MANKVSPEMNYFRAARGDPRARPEEELANFREQCGRTWLLEMQECLKEVEIFHTGMHGEALANENTMVRQKWERGRGPGTGGAKL